MERLHVLKYFLMLIFTTAVIILSIKAVKHLTDESISTTFQYRFGDDNRGNLNLMSMTICPGQFIKRQNETKYSLLQYNDSLPDLDWNINETLKFFKLGGNYDFGPGEMNHLWMPSYTFVTWVDPGILIRGSLRYSECAQGQSTSILINIMSSELPHNLVAQIIVLD